MGRRRRLTRAERTEILRFRSPGDEALMLSPADTIRSVRADILYRNECRQARYGGSRAEMGLIVVALGLGWGVVLGLFLPGLWAAESILQERANGTLESLLLTPVDRQRVIWAKLLARIRPLAAMAACCPVIGLVFGVLWGSEAFSENWARAEAVLAGGALGTAAGLLAGAEVLGFGFTAGALGISAALRGRGRIAVLVRVLFYEALMLLADAAILTGVLFPGIVLVLIPTSCLLLVCKLLFFNWRMGASLIDRCADLMDPLLLASEG